MKLTIVTVAYNAEATIAEAVASVVEQKRTGYELEYIVVDGASSDGTLAALAPFSDRIDRLISEPDHGLYDAMNKGLASATGDFIGFLNADDTYAHSAVLSTVASRLLQTGAEALYADLDYVAADGTGRVVRRWRSGTFNRRNFWWGWMPPHPTFFLSKGRYDSHGGYALDFHSAADYELMLRMLCKQHVRAEYVPEVIVNMRIGGVSNASWRNRLHANREDRRAWRMNGLRPMPWTLVMKPLRKLGQWIR